MNKYSLFLEFFATEGRPNNSKEDAEEKDDDWRGGIGSDRCDSDSRSEGKGGTVGEILCNTDDSINNKWAKHFAFRLFDDSVKALDPGWLETADDDIADAFTEENKNHILYERHFGNITSFDENEVCDDGNYDIEGRLDGSFDFDFAATFSGGSDNEKRTTKNNCEAKQLVWREAFMQSDPAKD